MVSNTLKSRGLKFLTVQEVAKSTNKNNIVIIDVRPKEDYVKGHIPGAMSAEYYRLIQGWDFNSAIRRAGFAFFGILNGTEGNPNFVDDVRDAIQQQGSSSGSGGGIGGFFGGGGSNKKVVLVCTLGGSLEPYGPSEFGQQTRSLMAAYALYEAGVVKEVCVLKGGFSEWCRGKMDIEIEEEGASEEMNSINY
jgi:rhodanese-related sulfurtransferase